MNKENFKPIKKIKFSRLITGPIRVLPDFLIIGAQKSGTTSMFNSLTNHSCVVKPIWKEIHFFDIFYNRGINWYRSCFHSSFYEYYQRKKLKKEIIITGESTPYYLYHPLCAQRIFKVLPHVKLIVILRNPIDRAYSHYAMSVRQGLEDLTFEDAIKTEQKRLKGENEKIVNTNYYSFKDLAYSYLSRGIYVNQLKIWMNMFPREQFLIIKSEDYASFPERILGEVQDFLSLPKESVIHTKKNIGAYEKMNISTRKLLSDFFEPYNEELYKFLGVNYGW